MVNQRKYRRRPEKAGPKRGRGPIQKNAYEYPRADSHLKPLFKKIGVPKPTPFEPDPFQVEALEQIKTFDVLVSAPTGSGKTWIASQAIEQYLSKGLRAWYATPLKALSNSIYQELSREFGSESCGILTGDRKENANAPVIVGTTEILRNQLYDAMQKGITIHSDLVILDEAHYLSDPDRGAVWEEVLIYLPPRVRLLLLSATVSNAEEIAAWLEENRGAQTRVVRSDDRPVPLEMLFLFPDGFISPLGGKKGLAPRIKRFVSSRAGKRRSGNIRFGEIIHCLRAFDLLPAIFFLKSRKDCNHALHNCPSVERPSELREQVEQEVKGFVQAYPHLMGHPQLDRLLNAAVGSHHAGQLPYWKMLIERMMNKGYLEVIFSTSTVAAGVNFPARTVVLVQSDRYDGHEFTNLTATDLHQMVGRAGRRGKDNIGFVLVVPGLHQDPELIHELRDSPPEPLMSQIHVNFSMTLNLLLSHTPMEVKDLLDHSFAAFQEKKAGSPVQRRWEEMLGVLNNALPRGTCDTGDPYEILENIEKRLEIKKDKRVMTREIRNGRRLRTYTPYLRPGRLFLHKNKGVYVIFHTYKDEGRLICAAHNIHETVRARKRKIRLRKVPFDKIRALYDYRVDLPEGYSLERLRAIFDAIRREELELLHVDTSEGAAGEEELDLIQKRLSELPCETCEHLNECHTAKNKKLKRILKEFRSLAYRMEGDKGGLWASFKRHLRFLKETDFLDETDQLTPDGDWASKLRLDQPLLIAEAIRKKALSGISPEVMAGCMAPFVWDRIQEVELQTQSPLNLKDCEDAFSSVIESIQEIRRLKAKRGFGNPPILFWPAAALFLWAKGVPWETLLSYIPVDEGDMASLILRTADHLRQVTNLKESHPELVSVARTAIERILREPVLIS